MTIWIRGGILFLTLTVGAGIVTNYALYFPPDYTSSFLQEREDYFWGWYSAAFYTHIIASPVALLLALLGFSKRLRTANPFLHSLLGRGYVFGVLLLVIPSGMVMAFKSFGGWIPATSFLILGGLTWCSTWMAFRAAISRRFDQHQLWMTRSFLLMFSAIVLRLNEKLLASLDPVFSYQVNSWISWLPIILFYEAVRIAETRGKPGSQPPWIEAR